MPPKSIVITHNPVTAWENYHRTLSAARGDFRDYVDDDRAMGGFWSCTFKMFGRPNVLKDFFKNGLGRNVMVYGSGMKVLHEGFVYEMVYNFPPDRYLISLKNMLNAIHMRADLDADGEVERSTVLENLESQGRFGIKEHVISGGQIDSLAVADQAAQAYIDLRGFPQPQVDRGKGRGEPYIEIFSKGYIETLAWRLFNCTDVGTQGTSAEVEDIVGHRASVRVIKPTTWDQLVDEEIADFDAVSPGLAWDQEFDEELADFDTISPTTWDQEFDEEIADFDALVPTWDKHADFEEGDLTDFDAEVDADGDLNAAMAAAHDGTWGARITFDDANVAYGRLDFGAIDQVSGVFSFWIRLNSYASTAAVTTNIANIEGGGTSNWYMGINENGGNYRFEYKYRTDVAGVVYNYSSNLADATWYHVLWMWEASTGAGNDDGWVRVFLNGVEEFSATGIDNDTRDGDHLIIGVTASGGAIFGGTLDFDEIYLDPVGAPMVNTLAKKYGSYGAMYPVIGSAAPLYGTLAGPAADTEMTGEMWLDPNSITMGSGNWIYVMTFLSAVGYSMSLFLTYDGADYRLIMNAMDDGVNPFYSGYHVISDDWHHIRMHWKAATAPAADDGYASLFIDGEYKDSITGLDTDTLAIGEVLFGPNYAPATCYGIVYMDDCRWADNAGPPDVYEFAAKEGTYGLAIFIDDTTVRYASFTDPAGETLCTWECWLNLDNLTMTNGDVFRCGYLYDAATPIAFIRITQTAGVKQIGFGIKDDAGAYTTSSYYNLASGWNHIRYIWAAATGVGNDDGYCHLFRDGVLLESVTGFDNDTRDVETVYFYAGDTLDAGTYGAIYFDDCRWDADAGPIDIYSFAARKGSYGVAIFIPNTTARYGELTDPANETEITVETWINPIGLTMATDDEFVCLALREDGAGVDVARINLCYDGTEHLLNIEAREDGGAYVVSAPVPIADHYGLVRLVLIASSGAGEDDGYLFLFWNELKILELSGLDNDTLNVDRIRSGAVSGLDAGTLGGLMLDHIRWSDDAVVTRTAESGVGQFVAGIEISANDTQVTTNLDADLRALDTVFNQAKLGDAGNNRWLIYMIRGRILHFAQAAPAVEVV